MTGTLAYERRIARVLAHIDAHAAAELDLDSLAEVSGFSKFHFHRVFKSMVGETLHAYVTRVRVERGAMLLVHGKVKRVGDAALASGWKTQAHFARAFRAHYGVPPSQAATLAIDRGEAASARARAWVSHERGLSDVKVQLDRWPQIELASLRVIGLTREALEAGFTALDAWLAARGIAKEAYTAVLRDDADLVPLNRFRYEIGAHVPRGTLGSGPVTVATLREQHVASLRVEGSLLDVVQGWRRLFAWLPTSGYEPQDAPALERIHRGPTQAGWEGLVVDLGLPVRRS